jgi:riboflavin synthase
MFTGIVAGQGTLRKISKGASGAWRLEIHHGGIGRGVRVGDSVAVNGCCLTVVFNKRGVFLFDVLQETYNRTMFASLRPGDRVNLENALRAGDPLGGHYVSGHIDGVGRIEKKEVKGADVRVTVRPGFPAMMKWLIPKGSVALDGVSLTVGEIGRSTFTVWVIPQTLKLTTLGWKREGDPVNLEGDLLAKYAQRTFELNRRNISK